MLYLFSCTHTCPENTTPPIRGKAALVLLLLTVLLLLSFPILSHSQDTSRIIADSTLVNTYEAGDEGEIEEPKRKLIKWNEYEGKYFTIRLGGGFLYEFATYNQDNENKEQIDLEPDTKMRDWRFSVKGRLKFLKPVSYTTALMYDEPTRKWLFRETGFMIAIPKLWGNVFIGRTKEGFSLNKVMVGYAGWTMERSAMSDATVPILGDGVKWLGFVPKQRIGWNIGYFFDKFNEDQTFSSYDNQVVARLMWMPKLSEAEKTVFHIGLNLRQGNVDKDTLQLRSRPEAFPAPYFVDTKKFHATSTFMSGLEVYYRKGPWLFGTEYWFEDVNAPENGNPIFHGGDIVVTWLMTGETRPYNTMGGYFRGISPRKTLFEGGPGAWEPVLRLSYIDLDDGAIRGGKFWRLTPMINWHMSDNLRLEFAYGFGKLDRFGLTGGTHFFQSRIQLQL